MFYWTLMGSMLAGDFVWWWRVDHQLKSRAARIIVAASVLLMIGYMLRILIWPYVPRHDSNIVIVWGFCLTYAWHLLVMPLTLIAMGIGAIFRRIARPAHDKSAPTKPEPREPTGKPSHAEAAPKKDAIGVSRRDLLRLSGIAAPPLMAFAGMGIAVDELFGFRLRRIAVPLRGLPAALDGMTISHVSDTHVGRFTNDRMLDAIAHASNALDPDLTLFAGDLIDIAQADLPPAIRFARQLRSRFGVYFCEGNHDLIEDGYRKTNVFETATRAAGLSMLFDEAATIRVRDRPVQIIGQRWSREAADRPRGAERLMALRDPEAFGILLAHHPHCWDGSTTPLTLAGHTHGGQLMLNEKLGVGPIMFRYWSGLYRRGDQALIVSNGTGNWFPVRTMAPAEIVHVTLRCA